MPLIPWYGWIGLMAAGGYLMRGVGDMTEDAAKLSRVAVAGGVVYVIYKATTK